MSWTTAREAIRTAVTTSLGLADNGVVHPVEWTDRRGAQRVVGSLWADMRVSPKTSHGRGETRYVYDSDTDALVAVRYRQSHFSVTVLVQSDSQEPDENAVDRAGLVETALLHPDVSAGLVAANVAVLSVGGVVDATYTDRDGRALSAAALEIRFATTEAWTPPVQTSGDYFTHALGEGVDGSELDNETFATEAPP